MFSALGALSPFPPPPGAKWQQAGCQREREGGRRGVTLRTNEVAHHYSDFINMVVKTTVRPIKGAAVPSRKRSRCSGEHVTANSSSEAVQSGRNNSQMMSVGVF